MAVPVDTTTSSNEMPRDSCSHPYYLGLGRTWDISATASGF